MPNNQPMFPAILFPTKINEKNKNALTDKSSSAIYHDCARFIDYRSSLLGVMEYESSSSSSVEHIWFLFIMHGVIFRAFFVKEQRYDE